jgi:hypothetical protein
MPLEALGGGGFDYVQDSQPNNPDTGETWFDSSVDNGAGKIYADLGGGAQWHVLPTQRDLQQGRTRELLLLLQDAPVPEIQDPLNLQSGLSSDYLLSGDYGLENGSSSTVSQTIDGYSEDATAKTGWQINPNTKLDGVEISINTSTNATTAYIEDTDNNVISQSSISSGSATINQSLSAGTTYWILVDAGGSTYTKIQENTSLPKTSPEFDVTAGIRNNNITESSLLYCLNQITGFVNPATSGTVTDRFAAPTTAPADFKQWVSIAPVDAATGGSTSANPVEFEILDSSDTVLNSARIPLSEMPFNLKGRTYSTNAGADGQSDCQIPQTGAGGHFGLPILSVVTVSVAGSVLDPANWQFDGVDTITIDTSTVTVGTGDEIEIVYDFDIFDSTLQPRAYLSRESSGETSPSISHFRYEYEV